MHADLKNLLEKYLAGELSAEEFRTLWSALREPGSRQTWEAFMKEVWDDPRYHQLENNDAKDVVLEKLKPVLKDVPRKRVSFMNRRTWWAAAASLLLLTTGVAYFLQPKKPVQLASTPSAPIKKNEVMPGGDKAILTLADGTTITLDSASNGMLSQQGNTKVVKLANGKLVYSTSGAATSEIMYNTMRTPRGGQYRITLPDGTQVWLNAASSITYPTAFSGGERMVKVTGEAYFEVAPLEHKTPFRVKIMSGEGEEKAQVTVLGTHFNINAYDNEGDVKTTLLEGSVKITKENFSINLKPGQQAQIRQKIEIVEPDDLEEITAWKEGYFKFNEADIGSILRQAERWYDITVSYPNGVPKDLFSGSLPRHVSLTKFLEILVYSDINAKIKERTVIINP
ncbi:FecR domain-containing protein [Chitinophaga niabensis]|uniref:FecR protein n=1 Tax=Chitinophaga niabensis TaxID=536979 RepID=A0A1N6IYC6_9BACT|nr:FecR domain-containing protein [Chitinophaga niabensis]SIO37108.1 FecR protein [Chitinophaga niabensis]